MCMHVCVFVCVQTRIMTARLCMYACVCVRVFMCTCMCLHNHMGIFLPSLTFTSFHCVQEGGHLSYRCPKNLLGEREPPPKKKKLKKGQRNAEGDEDEYVQTYTVLCVSVLV